MFTGIVSECGVVLSSSRSSRGLAISIGRCKLAADLKVGDSVNVEGCCLTVVETRGDRFTVEATPETLRLTNLGSKRAGNPVNLEPAARLSDFLGGHLVQGHVDQKGKVLSVRKEGNSKVFRISAPEEVLRHCVLKGSIAVNGVSLTISRRLSDAFEVTIIPHTLQVTTFSKTRPGDSVNLEVDIISKYVESHVRRFMTTVVVLCLFSLGQIPAGQLTLEANSILIYENETTKSTSQFVVRLARYRPDIVMEWESEKDQGTVHLYRKAVEESLSLTLNRLFEVGVDTESPQEMTVRISDELYEKLKQKRTVKIQLNRVPLKMKFVGAETFFLTVDQQPVELPVLRVQDSRGGSWTFLDVPGAPLIVEFKSAYFSQRLKSVSSPSRSSLRWIRKLPPVR